MNTPDCFALLDDAGATDTSPTSRLYTAYAHEHVCTDPSQLDEIAARVDADLRAGLHAVVLANYEWGARLLRAGDERADAASALRWLMFRRVDKLSREGVSRWLAEHDVPDQTARPEGDGGTPPSVAGIVDLVPSVSSDEYRAALAQVREALVAGECYQINYTFRLSFGVFGTPVALYRRLRAQQPVGYGALIALPPGAGRTHVLSCSPELFLRNDGARLTARPMKGTAPRVGDPRTDAQAAERLAADPKNRAENVMIVDLLRNDLGRVARTGSVRVPRLFSVEPYAAVLQMTSTVEATLREGVTFAALLRALFPCGSITGAPKHRTMQLIARIENTPRGLYTGAIGWLDAPAHDAACGDFCLSVAIRTMTLDAAEGDARGGIRRGTLGIGSGIVIDSDVDDEFDECLIKAKFLTTLDPGFALLETLYATRDAGIRNAQAHLARLRASAEHFGFRCDTDELAQALVQRVRGLDPQHAYRLRLTLSKDGSHSVDAHMLTPLDAQPVKVLLADEPLDADDPLLRHKTTHRARHDRALRVAARSGAFDMLFFNRAGQLTEGARSNVFVKLDGNWFTPPVACGLLPGVMRATLLADPAWRARERVLTLDDLFRADDIVVCNALRGAVAARLAARSCYPDYAAWLAYWTRRTNDRIRSATDTAAVRASAQDHVC